MSDTFTEARPRIPYQDVDPSQLSAEQILAQMEAAERAPEPGTTSVSAIIHSGDDDVPVQMRVNALRSAGYSYVYHTRTGERAVVNRNMMPAQLRKTLPDGSLAFSIVKPAIPPRRGASLCMLHKDHPRRAEFDLMGLPVCPKGTLVSDVQVELHMQHKHKSSWAAIEKKRERLEKDEDRQLQRAFMQAVTAGQVGAVEVAAEAARQETGSPPPLTPSPRPGTSLPKTSA